MTFILALLALWLGGSPSWGSAVQRVDLSGGSLTLTFDDRLARIGAAMLAPGGRADADARATIDLSRPALVADGALDARAPTLTLRLRNADDRLFARAAATGRMTLLPPFNRADPAARDQMVSLPVPAAPTPLSLPRLDGDPARPLVVIDPGHGGFDPGAIAPGGNLREKDITLQIARAIREELLRSGRARVALTRDDDRFLVLQERYGIARRLHADLFISIHCDSIGAGEATGASVYTLSEVASDKEAARLAARENRSDLLSGLDLGSQNADVSSILIDLAQRETMDSSAAFARLLGREARPLLPLKPQFHRFAALVVLKAPDMPSVLFETGYISNPKDAAFLASADGQHRVAQAVARAVEVNFARRLAAD